MMRDPREADEVPAYAVPEELSLQCLAIESTLARLETTYQKTMHESDRTESELVAEYLVAHADDVLTINDQARELGAPHATEWLAIIHRRINRLVYLRRAR